MKWFSRLRRWFASARLLCLALLFALLSMRVTDPLPLEELRLRAFDMFQVIKPRVATQRPVVIVDIDEAEPAQARPMALAAHPHRRYDHPAHQTSAPRPSPSTSCLPSRIACRRCSPPTSFAILTRKRGTSFARCQATIRSWPTRSSDRTSCLARPACRSSVPQTESNRLRPGSPYRRRSEAPFLYQISGPAAQRSGARQRRRRPRPVQHPHRARRHRAARADGYAGARRHHALADASRCCGW